MTIAESKRRAARTIWEHAIALAGVRGTEFGAPFRRGWNMGPDAISDELVFIADLLWALDSSKSEKSVPVFREKIRQLLRATSATEFLHCRSELAVGALLAPRASPIAFEPAVPMGADAANKPASSDYSLCLPSGEVFVEASVLDLQDIDRVDPLMRRLERKLSGKLRQSMSEASYVLALVVLGSDEMYRSTMALVNSRAWQNRKFRRYGAALILREDPKRLGQFVGCWCPNLKAIMPIKADLTALVRGERAYHLHDAAIHLTAHELSGLRQSVAREPYVHGGEPGIPVRLSGGPFDGMDVRVPAHKLSAVGLAQSWTLAGTATLGARVVQLPPHGPAQVHYRRAGDGRYEFVGFRFWINETRPVAPKHELLPRLELIEAAEGAPS